MTKNHGALRHNTRVLARYEKAFDRDRSQAKKARTVTTISTPNMDVEIVASEHFAQTHDEPLPPDPTGDWI